MVVNGARESFQVVIQDEHLDETEALIEPDGHEPGSRDQGEQGQAQGAHDPRDLEASQGDAQPDRDAEGYEYADGSLGQNRDAHQSPGRGRRRPSGDAQDGEDEEPAGPGDERRHQHIHGGRASVGEGQGRSGEDDHGQASARGAEKPCRHQSGESGQEQGGEDRGEPGRHLVLSKDPVAEAGQPVVQGRLFEPGLAGKGRSHEFVRARHLDRHPGVPRFIRTEQGNLSDPEEEQEDLQAEDDQGVSRRDEPRLMNLIRPENVVGVGHPEGPFVHTRLRLFLCGGAREGNRTLTTLPGLRILSPLRLPISPLWRGPRGCHQVAPRPTASRESREGYRDGASSASTLSIAS